MFLGWQTFYQLTGSAAGALIGLLFLVATLTAGRDQATLSEGMKLFSTPTVVNFAAVLLVSALALAPPPHDGWSVPAILACAALGLAYSLGVSAGLRRSDKTVHWSDFWFYGAIPTAVYTALMAATLSLLLRRTAGQAAIGLTVLALLMLAIRNAWDLITWLAPRRPEDQRRSD